MHRTVCMPGSIRRAVCDSNKPHSNSAWQQRRKKHWECRNTVFFPAFINTTSNWVISFISHLVILYSFFLNVCHVLRTMTADSWYSEVNKMWFLPSKAWVIRSMPTCHYDAHNPRNDGNTHKVWKWYIQK